RILDIDGHQVCSRRWFYLIPAKGTPQKIVSKVEPHKLAHLPGETHSYMRWQTLHEQLKTILHGKKKIAMNYSPNNNIPYISMIDLGTGDLIRSFNVEIVSAMNLIQQFEGLVDAEAFQTHTELQPIMHEITLGAFDEIGRRLKAGDVFTEYDIQQWMVNQFEKHNLITHNEPPIVGVNEHAADCHYCPLSEKSSIIRKGDLVLIDSWAKFNKPNAVFYDFTWMAYCGSEIPSRIQELWELTRDARDAAIALEKRKFANKEPCFGWELDKAARNVIEAKNLGDYFVHRLGHSIGQFVHGFAVHLDNFETHDDRQIVPQILHSIEPGIYIPEEKIGIRSECDVYITSEGKVLVTGPLQDEIIKIEC
ncbi:MAG: M24 family metallopeptidase, partial [Promethearchaeota archaeon]